MGNIASQDVPVRGHWCVIPDDLVVEFLINLILIKHYEKMKKVGEKNRD